MADFKERRFSIDPGKGKKMDGCPYSIYEDGRDVKDYIIPPKGYKFKGFRFDPDACNQIYDGRLIAEYEKESFVVSFKSNLWKFLLALGIIVVITVVTILAVNVFNKPKTDKPTKKPETSAVAKDTVKEEETKTIQPSDQVAPTNEVVKPSDDHNATVPGLDAKKDKDPVVETPQPAADDPNAQFKKEFWSLIHQRTTMMDPYDLLYKDNRNKVEGAEYEYLRYTILKDFNSFKEWSGKLRKVPATELESINTVKDLKNKLQNY